MQAEKTSDPFVIAKAIKESNNVRKNKLPHRRVFGNDMPTSVTTISPLQEKHFK